MSINTSRKLRVLLLSPLTYGPGFSGEDAYTQALLSYPPEGVEYIFHDDLVSSGKAYRNTWIPRIFFNLSEYRLGVLPYSWIQTLVSDEDFDLVHIHSWDAYLGGHIREIPLVISLSSSPHYGLKYYKGWSNLRVQCYGFIISGLLRSLRVWDSFYNPGPARRIFIWSRYQMQFFPQYSKNVKKMRLVRPGISLPERQTTALHDSSIKILFIGNDFYRKGGEVLMKAFRNVRDQLGNIVSLTVITKDISTLLNVDGLKVYASLPYQDVQALMLDHNVLALPSLAEGYGMAVIEAMAKGLVPVVSDAGALPEIVNEGQAGMVVRVNDVDALTGALLKLTLNRDLRFHLAEEAYAYYRAEHAIDKTNDRLRLAYEDALGGR